MAGYLIVRVQVTNWEQYRKYTEVTPGVIAKFGGKFIVRGGQTRCLEGSEESARIVIVEFPTFEKAIECYNSPEYCAAKAIRMGAAEAQFLAVEGVSG